MSNNKYPHLFTPVQAGGALFRNRIFAAPMGASYLDKDGFLMPEVGAFYERKALGGAASVCISGGGVSRRGMAYGGGMLEYTNHRGFAFYNYVTNAISRHGCMAALELQHGGYHATLTGDLGMQMYGPMETDYKGYHCLPMTEEIIQETIDDFVRGAQYAKSAGFGMVTIHGGHGWLLHQFMSPIQNQRTDKWGGSLENRMRFPLAVVEAVRKAVGPKYPIELRMSGAEMIPGGYDADEGVEMAKFFDGKVDMINVSMGHHEDDTASMFTHPNMFMDDGCNVKYAAAIKKAVSVPVECVGGITDPEQMEEIIASGQADVIQLGRQSLADPYLPIKARTGNEDDINHCMRCYNCFHNSTISGIFYCATNPEIGHEYESLFDTPPRKQKKVLIAGGGIGGMQAAITAAQRGHEVILCEKSERLGGVLRCEELVPFKERTERYLDHQVHMLEKSGVDVRLNTEVTPELAKEIKPDVIIAAMGADILEPRFIKGWDRPNVIAAEELYTCPDTAGQRVVILGGGLVGMELAAFLGMKGKDVTILEMMPTLNDGGNNLHGLALSGEFETYGVKVSPSTKAIEITEEGVIGEFTGAKPEAPQMQFDTPHYKPMGESGTMLFPADTVAYALGRTPRRSAALALRECAPEFHMIGDCVAMKNIQAATSAGYFTARDIGRKY